MIDRDTVYEIKVYDKTDSLLDTWKDFDEVRYVSIFKNYLDNKHTYKDDNGKDKPLPVSLIVDRFDKVSKSKWLHIDYTRHTYTDLIESKEDIIRTDTVAPVAANPGEYSIYKYYKAGKSTGK